MNTPLHCLLLQTPGELLEGEKDFLRLGSCLEAFPSRQDPSSLYGDDSPTQTFPGLRKKEEQRYGEYRTKRLILSAWDQA